MWSFLHKGSFQQKKAVAGRICFISLFADKTKIEIYLFFDWSSSFGNFFLLRISKIHFNYFEEKYFATQTIKNDNAPSQIYFAAKSQVISHNVNPP